MLQMTVCLQEDQAIARLKDPTGLHLPDHPIVWRFFWSDPSSFAVSGVFYLHPFNGSLDPFSNRGAFALLRGIWPTDCSSGLSDRL